MNLVEETAKTLLVVTVTGLVSGLIWLFKWRNIVDLRIHDQGRDIAHIQRTQAQLSTTIAQLDSQDEKIITTFRADLNSIDQRVGRIETRLYVIEVIVKPPITQV